MKQKMRAHLFVGFLFLFTLMQASATFIPSTTSAADEGHSFSQPATGNLPGRDPETVWREIKTLAEQEVAAESVSFGQAGFVTNIVGSEAHLTIKKGSAGDLGFADDDPYKVPVSHQIQIESLRRALGKARLSQFVKEVTAQRQKAAKAPARTPAAESSTTGPAQIGPKAVVENEERWKCYLDQAELLVKQTVLAIETIDNKTQLNLILKHTGDQIDDLLYNKIFESIEEYASENGINVVYDRGGAPPLLLVPISSVPAGARVWVVTQLNYRLTRPNANPPWRELVQNPAQLRGKYRYKARWPDGRETEDFIDIKDASPVTLRQ